MKSRKNVIVVVDTTQHSEGFCRQCGMGGDRCVCEEIDETDWYQENEVERRHQESAAEEAKAR